MGMREWDENGRAFWVGMNGSVASRTSLVHFSEHGSRGKDVHLCRVLEGRDDRMLICRRKWGCEKSRARSVLSLMMEAIILTLEARFF